MAVVAKSDTIYELVARDVEVEQLAGGFSFTEGPVWHPREHYLLFSDMPADVRRRWDAQDGVREVMSPSNKCNGLTYDAELNLIVCEHLTSTVVRERPDGARETIASHYDGRELNSPNDVIVASDGSILFSDPSYGRMAGFGKEREQELGFQGVFRIPAGGGDPELLADDFGEPNGLCFSPDGSRLYVNDTDRAHIRVWDVAGDGSLSSGRVFAEGIGEGDLAKGGLVDGMKCDERGNVWVTGPDGIWVFSPAGEHLGVVEIPESAGNLHWGGAGWSELYVCASTGLYRFAAKVSAAREPFMS